MSRRISVQVVTRAGTGVLVRRRGMTERTPNGISVSIQNATQQYALPTRPTDDHNDFWRLDFSSPARSGYATLL